MPLVLIDNFFPDPTVLVKDAQRRNFTANAPYFPGIRAAVPGAYFKPIMGGLSDVLLNVFNYKKGIDVQECQYSLTTTAGKDLHMVQRIPHVDGGNDMKIALLHYLCGHEHGGTAFYRQCRTGFETVPNERFPEFEKAVITDHEIIGAPKAAYFNKTDRRFEQFYRVDAKFNRAVLYFSCNLHSLLIGTQPLTSDPKTGRLTINTFLQPF